jgi:hypothetical protein
MRRGGAENGPTIVRDAEAIKKLQAFFPQLGSGKKSRVAGAWKPRALCVFVAEDGARTKVSTTFALWSTGDGDWWVNGDLASYLGELTK